MAGMRKTVLQYSLAIAAAAFLLQWLEYKYTVRLFSTEIYIVIIALLFMLLGIWVGIRLTSRKVGTPFEKNTRALAGSEGLMQVLEWLGYLVMIIALSMIFIGIKRYRDQELGGVIRFGTAALLGLGITAVASVVYVVAWELNLVMTDYAFIHDYTASIIASEEAAGVAGAELEQVVAEMESLKQQYASPLYRVPMTFLEIFPVGLVITLLSALLLRNPRIAPATAPTV